MRFTDESESDDLQHKKDDLQHMETNHKQVLCHVHTNTYARMTIVKEKRVDGASRAWIVIIKEKLRNTDSLRRQNSLLKFNVNHILEVSWKL